MRSDGAWPSLSLAILALSVVVAGACGGTSVDAQLTETLEPPPESQGQASDEISTEDGGSPGTGAGDREVALPAAPSSDATDGAIPSGESSRIRWDGNDLYLHGANLPWVNFGCDFGCGDNGGASSASTQAVASTAFQHASEMGMSVVRWWVFPGEPRQILLDAEGLPRAIDPRVFPDLDAAVDLAEQFDLDLVLTLFSAPSHLPDAWVESELGRVRLSEALSPMFERYTGRVMTWQVFNEPEWDFWIWERSVDVEGVRALVDLVAEVVHGSSDALVSVGSARLDGLQYWIGSELDYFTVHWYDPMVAQDQCAICTTYGEISALMGSDVPIVIGEFYAGSDIDAADRFQQFHDRGYAGALAWSLLPGRTNDRMAIDPEAAEEFARSVRQG